MKKWQKQVLEITKDEPMGGIFSKESIKKSFENNGYKVSEFKKKKR